MYLQHRLIYAVCEDHSKVESKEAKEASNYVIAFDPESRQRHIMVCFHVQFSKIAHIFSYIVLIFSFVAKVVFIFIYTYLRIDC